MLRLKKIQLFPKMEYANQQETEDLNAKDLIYIPPLQIKGAITLFLYVEVEDSEVHILLQSKNKCYSNKKAQLGQL